MSAITRRFGVGLGIVLGLATLTPGRAQWPAPYPYPAPWSGGFGPGNVLNGQANVIGAQGDLMLQQEQARIDREKANQAKIQTKKQTLDWKNYERANTWTFTDEQDRNKSLLLRRMLSSPSDAEITSGRSLNVIMPYLHQLAAQGVQGPPVPLFPALMKDVNVTVGSAPSVGLLRSPGPLQWPLSLQGPAQEKLDGQVTALVAQGRAGKVDPALFTEVQKGITSLRQDLNNKYVTTSGVDVGAWVSGRNFLDELATSVRAVGRPGASQFLNNNVAAQGRTVDELVMNMTSNGLRFAPATVGREAAYFALQSAFTTFAAGAQNGSGFRMQVPPSQLSKAVAPGPR
jgi:hypothetical protein